MNSIRVRLLLSLLAMLVVAAGVLATVTYRNVLGEIVSHRLGRSVAKSFPGLKYQPLGVVAG